MEVDDRGVSYTDPDGQVSTLAWEELQLIGVETTSAGPFLEDVFFCLEGANTRIAIPQSAEGCKELVNRLTGMEGFDCSAFTKAMCSTHDAFFVCWKKKRPEEPA